MKIDITTYSGPFPVQGRYDPTTSLLETFASPSHELVSEGRIRVLSKHELLKVVDKKRRLMRRLKKG